MSHDKIKAAARRRMARTGESYVTARREVIKAHKATQRSLRLSEVYGPQLLGQVIGNSALTEPLRQAMAAHTSALTEPLRQAMAAHMPQWPID